MAGDDYFGKIRDRKNATNTGTNAGVSATISSAAGFKYAVTGVQCSGDADATVTIESPASTIVWQKDFSADFAMSETFAPGTVVGAVGSAILVKVSTSTTKSKANIQALKVP